MTNDKKAEIKSRKKPTRKELLRNYTKWFYGRLCMQNAHLKNLDRKFYFCKALLHDFSLKLRCRCNMLFGVVCGDSAALTPLTVNFFLLSRNSMQHDACSRLKGDCSGASQHEPFSWPLRHFFDRRLWTQLCRFEHVLKNLILACLWKFMSQFLIYSVWSWSCYKLCEVSRSLNAIKRMSLEISVRAIWLYDS